METTGGQMPGRWMIHRAKDSCSEHSHPKNSQSCFLHLSRDRLMTYTGDNGWLIKDKKQKRKHTQSWGQVDWVLGWRHKTTSCTSSEFIIYSSKTRRWATVLQGRGCDSDIIVLWTGETCDCFSLNVNILRKAAMLHFVLTLLHLGPCQTKPVDSVAGAMPNSACRLFDTAVLTSSSHRPLILHSPYLHLFYYLKCTWRSPSSNPSSCLCTMWNLTERTRKQVNNNTLIPAKYQKECLSMLNGLQSFNSSRMFFSY
jgi:hypothetical protein